MRKARRVVTVSEFSKQDMLSHYSLEAHKIGVVNNGANESYTPLSESEKREAQSRFTGDQPYFIFISSIHPRKNLQRILPAFFEFKKRTNSNARMLVVGSVFWQDKDLKAAIDMGKASGDIIMAGRLAPSDLRLALGGAVANVYASYFEGFGIPIVEAFQAGVPVITSNVTSMPEIADHAALLVNPFSIEEIASAMEKIWSDEKLREQCIARGLERSKNYTWDIAAEKMWNEINSCLKWQD